MPICKRDGFENTPRRNKNEIFHDNEDVFYCEVTKEIFRNYEDYFRHVMIINSTVWQCEATGRENLTYAEALKSERRARKKLEAFKHALRAPVMLVIEKAKQSSLNALCTIAAKFLRRRYFLQEEVTACQKTAYNAYTVVEIIPPGKVVSPTVVYDEVEELQYRLRRTDHSKAEIIVPWDNVRRQRSEFTSENLQMFLKNNIVRIDGILHPKPDSYKKYVTDPKITFASIFIGKMPHFTPSKVKNHLPNDKKQSTINNYLIKNGEKNNAKLNNEEIAKREKTKADKAEAKAKSLQEQMERLRREKQEKLAELERQKLEKRAKLMAKIEAECTELLTKTDDLERTDQRLLPTYTPINTYIPTKLVGDAFVVREFMHSFAGLLSGIETFRDNLSYYEMSRAFTCREVAGPLSDILLIFLGTIFELQKEEEEECAVEYLKMRKEMLQTDLYINMSQAARTHFFVKRFYSSKINEMPIDALTLSEVLRLHLLSSGAMVNDRAKNWRLVYRNGYTSFEDPGLVLRMQYPHIIRALQLYTVYQLPFADIVRILQCLISQILTYSSPLNVIEERMDETSKARISLRSLNSAENMRLSSVQAQKRALTNEFNQQCTEKDVKDDAEKKRVLTEKLNNKIADLLAHSERERKKYEQQVEKLQAALFNFLVNLGMDRAYRKYYVLESIPGIFVEHVPDSMDTCLSDPPRNLPPHELKTNLSSLPKTRKELRAYLLKMYSDQEKQAAKNEKLNLANKNCGTIASQENKENQGIAEAQEHKVANGLLNGIVARTDASGEKVDGTTTEPMEEGSSSGTAATAAESISKSELLPPTQYQLYMCTGDGHNCIVHDECNVDRQRWSYLYEKEDIEALINSLNPLGERESRLREQLSVLRDLILRHVERCPAKMLSLDDKQISKFKSSMMYETARKYSKANYGFGDNVDLNDVMRAVLLDRILQFEMEIYTGDLGRLKVENMVKWREALQSNAYNSQVKLQWGLSQSGGDVEADNEEEPDDEDLESGQPSAPYGDPGAHLSDMKQLDSKDSDDDEISLHDSPTIRASVKALASALLQVEQSIERRFLKEPFGVPLNQPKDRERKLKFGAERLKHWEISLMECTSYSQVFLHLNILHDSIMWARSTNKSSCQVCRRVSDPDKMLLCDECNGGTHMFCMKPKMKTVPEGNWYCKSCAKRLEMQNELDDPKKKTERRAHKRNQLHDEDIENILGEQDIEKEEGIEDLEEIAEEDIEYEDELAADTSHDDDDDDDDDAPLKNGNDSDISGNKSDPEEEDDVLICTMCSYDGGDVVCVRCKDAFHLECIKLKRAPRYIFICSKCRSKHENEKKRKFKDTGIGEPVDRDEDMLAIGPVTKRQRPQRSSLRNSFPNDAGSEPRKSNSNRRSNRRTGDNLPLNSSTLYRLLDDIMKHEQAWPFLRPVLQSEVPDYYKIIKTPMDFAKVKSKLNMGHYQLNEEVMSDIQLIFSNCDQYNVKGNEIYEAGSALENYVIQRCSDLNLPFKPSDMSA